MASHTFTHYVKPWSLNAERSMHFHKRAKLVDKWRAAFKELGEEVAGGNPWGKVIVTVHVEWKDRRWFPDVGACMGAAKAAIDGLVDAKLFLLNDDNPDTVRELRFKAPRVTGRYAITLVVREYENDGAEVE